MEPIRDKKLKSFADSIDAKNILYYGITSLGKFDTSRKYDIVVCSYVLENIGDPHRLGKVLTELFLLAKKGIYVVVKTSKLHPPSWWVRRFLLEGWLVTSDYDEKLDNSLEEVTIYVMKTQGVGNV